jgi:hypothetical protein
MNALIESLNICRNVLFRVTEIGAALLGIAVIFYLLLGADSGPYVTSVVANVSHIIEIFTPQALIALALVVFGYKLLKIKLK